MLSTEICRVVVEQGGHRLAWVGFAQDDERRSLRIAGRSGYDIGYLEQSRTTWSDDDERGPGPSGEVLRTGQIIACNDLLSDPEASPRRNEATRCQADFNRSLPVIEISRHSSDTGGVCKK